MTDVKVVIDGRKATFHEGMTILEAAAQIDIDIPTLCHRPEISPTGVCRICVVEIEGSERLIAACHTPIAQGMVINTQSPKVLASRKATVELMLTAHTGPCVVDMDASKCELHKIASDLEVGPPRFQVRQPRYYPVEEISPYVRRDLSKCILCRRCIKACEEIAMKNIYSIAYRGFGCKVVVDCDELLNKEICRNCGICIDYCPTGALNRPVKWTEESEHKGVGTQTQESPLVNGKVRQRLLTMLKNTQENSGYISKEVIAESAQNLGIPVSDVYGVTTFYSFLSTRPLGRNVIRICKSLPCYLKNAPMIIEAVTNEIGISPGEMTTDGKYSFELTNCIGACDKAPAMLLNHDVHGNLTPGKISEILKSYP